eukprot:6477692-Amphidinium_carterae.1
MGRSAVFFLDLHSAFPSISHEYIWHMMRLAGSPDWLVRAIQNLYSQQRVHIKYSNDLARPFILRVGVRQGCPLSSVLFIWALDGFLRHCIAGLSPDSGLTSFADDIAVVLAQINSVGVRAIVLLRRNLASVNLRMNFSKVRVLPLHVDMQDEILATLSAYDQEWGDLSFADLVKYLGFYIGPRGEGLFDDVIGMMLSRTDALHQLHAGMPAAVFLSKALITSLCVHRLRLQVPDKPLRGAFQNIFRTLTPGPREWLNVDLGPHLKHLGFPSSFLDADALSMKFSLAFVLRRGIDFNLQFQQLLNARNSADALAVSYADNWLHTCSLRTLADVTNIACRGGILRIRHGGRVVAGGPVYTEIRPKNDTQLIARWLVSKTGPRGNGVTMCRMWLEKRLEQQWGHEFATHGCVCRALAVLQRATKLVPPRCCGAWLRIIVGGVVVPKSPDPCSCLITPGCRGYGSLEHYVIRSCWWKSVRGDLTPAKMTGGRQRRVGFWAQWHPSRILRMICRGVPDDHEIVSAFWWAYAVVSTINRERTRKTQRFENEWHPINVSLWLLRAK